MKRPAKTATKSKWIDYADALEAADDVAALEAKVVDLEAIDRLEAKIAELERVGEIRRAHINQLKRMLSNG